MYYLSAEFLMGRTLTNAVHNMGLQGEYAEVSGAQCTWVSKPYGPACPAAVHGSLLAPGRQHAPHCTVPCRR